MPEREIYQTVVSQLATRVPLFAKAIVNEGLRRVGATPYNVSVVQMLQVVREYIEPRLASFLSSEESLEGIRTGVLQTDASDRILYLSQAARRILGLPGRLAGQDCAELFRRARKMGFAESAREMARLDREILFRETRVFPPGGGTFHVTHWLARDDRGRPKGVVSVFQDVSLMTEVSAEIGRIHSLLEAAHERLERHARSLEELVEEKTVELRRSEQDNREVFEAAADGFFTCDPDLDRLQTHNRAFAEVCGRPSGDLRGVSLSEFLPAEELQGRLGGKRSASWETTLDRGGGEDRQVSLTLTRLPLRDRVLGIVRDVTEQRLMEVRLAHLERIRALGEMAAGVAHDFNNMLSIILGFAQSLAQDERDPGRQEDLRTIVQTAQDGAQAVRRLQEFSRVRQDREFYPVDLQQVLEDAVSLTRPRWRDGAQAAGKRIRLVKNLVEVPTVEGNAAELREACFNLIGNAVEAIRQEGTIEVGVRRAGDRVVVEVSDDGAGMKPEVLRRALQPFFSTKGLRGHGLGLSMCSAIVSRHGGEIHIDSTPGEGTRVQMVFAAADPLPAGRAPREPVVSLPAGLRILVADDEERIVEVVTRILEAQGSQVIVCPGGRQAVDRLGRGERCDLVVTDLGMPEVSGWDVARVARGLLPGVGILLLTGWGLQISRADAEGRGVDVVLAKPFTVKAFLEAIAQVLERRAPASTGRQTGVGT
ncbi:MAG: ATP-binding protein [Candidatus Eisenbacteria bacterium]